MTFPTSHKTIFLMDHSPHFLKPCEQSMDFDIFTKTRQPGLIPLAPITKSLWTCTVEAALEYCRIVWDIYPTDKLIRYFVNDATVHSLNSWSQEDQNHNEILKGLAKVGIPEFGTNQRDCNILNGLTAALEALCVCSDIQHEKRTTSAAEKVVNRGRIVCVTNFKSDAHAKNIEDCFLAALAQHNKIATSSEVLIPIQYCELVLIHSYPVTEEPGISQIARRELSPILTSEIHTIKSGRHLAAKLTILVQQHYNLASTTVTGIPMKEEQNANSSANYDVELLHPAVAHYEVFKTGAANADGLHMTTSEGQLYDTVTLKWCTPRNSSIELQYCTGAYRITPVDVNSRPSSCLTNFLLGGRSVMLEMPRKSGSKFLSHMLSSHGGELLIHTLGTGRSVLEDPPSISEGCGGRVTDYRINDFRDFMDQNRLFPYNPDEDSDVVPIEKAKENLFRMTKYWPMIISNTTIFNIPTVQPLTQLVLQESLTKDDVVECKKVIYQLIGLESKGTTLPVPSTGTRGKGPKKEEQYRQLWSELESFLKLHSLTAEHQSVLDCLLECRKNSPDSDPSPSSVISSFPTKKEKLKEEEDGPDNLKILPSAKKMKTSSTSDSVIKGNKSSGPLSLLDHWLNKLKSEQSGKHREFHGRLNSVNGMYKLYSNLKSDQNTDEEKP